MVLPYSIAICTRNRPDILRLTIELMLNQTRQPEEILVVDSSEEVSQTVSNIATLQTRTSLPLIHHRAPRGLTVQRNFALERVKSPVVFFPDDDSLWYPDTAEIQMRIYEQDHSNEISAVCGFEVKTAPQAIAAKADAVYTKSRFDKFKAAVDWKRAQIESSLFPDPIKLLGRQWIGKRSNSASTIQGCRPVEYMTGFRMSFRTEAIRQNRFDENLKNYSLGEDIDASLSAWSKGMVVAAEGSRVYHHRARDMRAEHRTFGVTSILNRAYILCKHTDGSNPVRMHTMRFLRYKTFLYLLGSKNKALWGKFAGAKAALPHCRGFLGAKSIEDLQLLYRTALEHCLLKR